MQIVNQGKFPVPVDRRAVAEDWKLRGYSCGVFVDPPGRQWNDFVHETNELVTVIEGELRMKLGAETCLARPGDEIFIPRRTLHSVANVHSGTTLWLFGYD